jgi:cyanate lyase
VGATLDEVRRLVLDKSRELDITMKDMSKAVGKSETFIQQFIKRGTPRYLPEEVRYKLAR